MTDIIEIKPRDGYGRIRVTALPDLEQVSIQAHEQYEGFARTSLPVEDVYQLIDALETAAAEAESNDEE